MVAAARQSLGFAPRLLRRERAAAYLDVSPNHFDRLVKDGRLPCAKVLSEGVKVWDRADLDAVADVLPYDVASQRADTTWSD